MVGKRKQITKEKDINMEGGSPAPTHSKNSKNKKNNQKLRGSIGAKKKQKQRRHDNINTTESQIILVVENTNTFLVYVYTTNL